MAVFDELIIQQLLRLARGIDQPRAVLGRNMVSAQNG